MLKRLIYFSSEAQDLSPSDLRLLWEQAKSYNARNGITGLLVYKDGCFCQTLEAEEGVLNALLKKLLKDKRHRNVLVLDQRPIEKRMFKNWSMAFENLDEPNAGAMTMRELDGYLTNKFSLPNENCVVPHMLTAFVRPASNQPYALAG